jgi:uncharacterized membrane protein YkvA (DUF1232 family)
MNYQKGELIATDKLTVYSKHFSDSRFWSVIRKYAKQLGKEGIRHALTLYYAMLAPETPAWAKAVIAGALGYLILPVDAIPDVLPMVGLTDDLGILAAAVAAIEVNIPRSAKDKADEKMERWFGLKSSDPDTL